MISFVLIIICALDFIYLNNWANKVIKRSFRLDSSSNPAATTEKHSILTYVSVILPIVFGLILVAISFWGLTDNPYVNESHKPWIRAGDEFAIYVLLVLCTAIGLSYRFIYLVGKVHGIESWKQTSVYLDWVQKWEREKSRKSSPDSPIEF